jgi:ATP-independent RNA helicase DbpA
VQALVLCPTRELADQVTAEIRRLARAEDNIKVVTLCGGVPLRGQLHAGTRRARRGRHAGPRDGPPGRGSLQLDALNTLVLDEADRMLDMGFHDDIVEGGAAARRSGRRCCSPRPIPEASPSWPAQFMRSPATVKVEAQHATRRSSSAGTR